MEPMLNEEETQSQAQGLRQTAKKQFEKERAWTESEARVGKNVRDKTGSRPPPTSHAKGRPPAAVDLNSKYGGWNKESCFERQICLTLRDAPLKQFSATSRNRSLLLLLW